MARATRELAAALAGRGHAVHVITRSGDDVGHVDGATVHAIAAPPLERPAAVAGEPVADHLAHAAALQRKVAEIHEREGVDAVLTPLWCCEGIVCLLDDRYPTVVSCMTSMTTLEEIRNGTAGDAEAAQLTALEQATMRRAHYVHGLTQSSLDKALADFGARPAESAVVGRGAADRAGTEDGNGSRQRASRSPEILFVGRLEQRKGVDVLLDAAGLMAAAGTDFSLVLAGPDSDDTQTGEPYRETFQNGAGHAAAAERVRFAGPVGDAELTELYRRADVVCVPSRYESHGVVLVEAMMFGKPIVACEAGGVPEVVEAGGNALLARPGDPRALADCLRLVAGDADLRARYGARSRELYEQRFEPRGVAERMTAFLARVSDAHEPASTAPADLRERLAAVVAEVLPVDSEAATEAACDLLAPSAASWRAATERADAARTDWRARALEAEHQLTQWRERALEAERQRAAAEGVAATVASSRSWRLTRPLRRLAAALRRSP
ncbi:MAG: hypothetical protein QOI65_1044 [Thermoleophilaceae bacterium]|nr:hypothetical protein [Thermoleophilaceae bacterium]